MEEHGVLANSRRLATAYAQLAAQLNAADVKSEAAALRTALERAPNILAVARLGEAYASKAIRLTDEADIIAAADTLHVALEQGRNDGSADSLAYAYAIIATAMMDRADARAGAALVREILTLAGHPFVSAYAEADLLAALQRAAGAEFGGNVGAAVQWAEETYGMKARPAAPVASPGVSFGFPDSIALVQRTETPGEWRIAQKCVAQPLYWNKFPKR